MDLAHSRGNVDRMLTKEARVIAAEQLTFTVPFTHASHAQLCSTQKALFGDLRKIIKRHNEQGTWGKLFFCQQGNVHNNALHKSQWVSEVVLLESAAIWYMQ